MKYLFAILLLAATSCTINIIQTDTHGISDDVVDDTTSQKVDPKLSIPVKPL